MTDVVHGPVRAAFEAARREGRSLLVAYLPAGFPTVAGSAKALTAMVGAGVDVVEVGLPYSDPVMDGPVIQSAVDHALRHGTRIVDTLQVVREVAETGAPTLVMSYWNPIERYGSARFATDLADAGGAGVITPDLTPEEAEQWCSAARDATVDTVFLVAPSSPDPRIDAVASITTGFVYAASLMGVTGARSSVGAQAEDLVRRVRARTDAPVAVGLGVSTPEQAAEVARYADGVIVGSAFVRAIQQAPDEAAGIQAAADLARDLSAAVHAVERD